MGNLGIKLDKGEYSRMLQELVLHKKQITKTTSTRELDPLLEESGQFRFLHVVWLTNINGSVGAMCAVMVIR
jgi:hypothetical protein